MSVVVVVDVAEVLQIVKFHFGRIDTCCMGYNTRQVPDLVEMWLFGIRPSLTRELRMSCISTFLAPSEWTLASADFLSIRHLDEGAVFYATSIGVDDNTTA
jgi:hypothetical protein